MIWNEVNKEVGRCRQNLASIGIGSLHHGMGIHLSVAFYF